MPLISVCIAAGRLEPLRRCLASLAAQRDAPSFEVLIGVRSAGGAWSDVAGLCPGTRLIQARGNAGAVRNALVRQASGELLLFLDDDVTADPALLARLATLSTSHPEVEVFGGPNVTPRRSSFFQMVQGAVLASIVGSGPVRRRYGKHPAGPADETFFILCNLAVRRRSMLPFGQELICAEENALLFAMSKNGLAMRYDPELLVFHERRRDLSGFARQMFKYGFGRGQIISGNPATVRLAYLLPSSLVAYLAALPLLAGWSRYALAPLLLYLGAVAADAAKIAFSTRRSAALPLAGVLTVLLHLSYGLGVVRGVFSPSRRLVVDRLPAPRETVPAVSDSYGTPNQRG